MLYKSKLVLAYKCNFLGRGQVGHPGELPGEKTYSQVCHPGKLPGKSNRCQVGYPGELPGKKSILRLVTRENYLVKIYSQVGYPGELPGKKSILR